jgi:SagB-type dehydrogenase family enzyme
MNKNFMRTALVVMAAMLAAMACPGAPRAVAAEKVIKLAQPNFPAGKTVLEALKERRSERNFKTTPLTRQELSEILWAAAGVNRELPDGQKGRTGPSSHGAQAIDLYAVMSEGVYQYDFLNHQLLLIAEGDFRASAGIQKYVAAAPLNLIYVVNLDKEAGADDYEKRLNGAFDAGHWSENVYLYAASAGLNVIVRSSVDQRELRDLLKLPDRHEPLLGQTLGHR